jgi:hypothetical protein
MVSMEEAKDLLEIVSALRDTNDALAQATINGDIEEASRLLTLIAALERRRNRIVHRNRPAGGRAAASYESSIPLRDQVIRALHLTGRPLSARLVSDVTQARWAERVDTTKLSSLRRDEARSWRKAQEFPGRNSRSVLIVPVLTYDRFTPVRGSVALSTWPVELRLMAPLSPRVDMLRSTIALAEEAAALTGTSYEGPMVRLVGRLGATIPGIKAFETRLDAVIEAAKWELKQIEGTDEQERFDAAERAVARLNEEEILFGTQFHAISTRAVGGSE